MMATAPSTGHNDQAAVRGQRSLSPLLQQRQRLPGFKEETTPLFRGRTNHNNMTADPSSRKNDKPKPKLKLLVDYSKKRATLTLEQRQFQSERSLLLPRRSCSMDATVPPVTQQPLPNESRPNSNSRTISRRRQQQQGSSSTRDVTRSKLLQRNHTTGMLLKSQSARDVVDWDTIRMTLHGESSPLVWQHLPQQQQQRARTKKEHAMQMKMQQQQSKSCSNVLRQTTTPFPVHTTSSSSICSIKNHHETEFLLLGNASDLNHPSPTIAISRRSSSRGSLQTSLELEHQQQQQQQRKTSILRISPQQMDSGWATSTKAVTVSSSLDQDLSMPFDDVFDSGNSSGRMQNDGKDHGTRRHPQEDKQHETQDEPKEPDHEADPLLQRWDKETKSLSHQQAPPQLRQEKLYRSMSAVANKPWGGQPHPLPLTDTDKSKSNLKNGHEETSTLVDASTKQTMEHAFLDDVSVAGSQTSISFRRSNLHSKKDKHGPATTTGKSQQHFLAGTVLGMKSWDGDFDNNSLSSFSSHWEPMSDLSSISGSPDHTKKGDARRATASQKVPNVPGTSHATTTKARSKQTAYATALGLKDDDDDEDEEDLLFLPNSSQPEPKLRASRNTAEFPSSSSSRPSASTRGERDLPDLKPSIDSANMDNSLTLHDVSKPASKRRHSNEERLHRSAPYLRHSNSYDEKNNHILRKGTKPNLKLRGPGDSDPDFNLRFAVRKQQPGKRTSLTNSSDPLLSYNSSDSSLGIDEEEWKKQKRNSLIQSNSSFRQQMSQQFKKVSNSGLMNSSDSGDDDRDLKKPPPRKVSPSRGRPGIIRQLSCDMLECEYDRLTKGNRAQMKKSQSSRSVSPKRRNAALLVPVDPLPKTIDQRPKIHEAAASPKLVSKRAATDARNMANPTTTGQVGTLTRETNQARNILPAQGTSRRDIRRPNRSVSPTRRTNRLPPRTFSNEEKRGDKVGNSSSGGFRDSLIRQASFVTGSRIRRHGANVPQNTTKGGPSIRDPGLSFLHRSSPSLSLY
jgi:hypothetical protein